MSEPAKVYASCSVCGQAIVREPGAPWSHVKPGAYGHLPLPKSNVARSTQYDGTEFWSRGEGSFDHDLGVVQMEAVYEALRRVYGNEFWEMKLAEARQWLKLWSASPN